MRCVLFSSNSVPFLPMLAIQSCQQLVQSVSNDHTRFDPCLALAVPMGSNKGSQRHEIRSRLLVPRHRIGPICFSLIVLRVVLYERPRYLVESPSRAVPSHCVGSVWFSFRPLLSNKESAWCGCTSHCLNLRLLSFDAKLLEMAMTQYPLLYRRLL